MPFFEIHLDKPMDQNNEGNVLQPQKYKIWK